MEEMKRMTPVKAIRAKCLDCCCDQSAEVRLCQAEECPLWPYRMGHNPARKRELTEEQKAEIGERLNRARMENF